MINLRQLPRFTNYNYNYKSFSLLKRRNNNTTTTTTTTAATATAAAANVLSIKKKYLTIGKISLVASISSIGAIYAYDSYNVNIINRCGRMLWGCFLTLIDYKFLYDPSEANLTHFRVAERLLSVCKENGGLYIKMGQAIAAMNHVLPLPFRQTLSVLHDQAPSVPFDDVRLIIKEDFNGASPTDLFLWMDETPIASASVAQVHRAALKDGTLVAVKVQKPYIRKQLPYDMACYKFCVYALEFFFDLPLVWTIPYTVSNLSREVDFINEGRNCERASFNLTRQGGGSGLDDIYIPKVYWNQTSQRVLTCEWIDGFRITDTEHIGNELGLDMNKIIHTYIRVLSEQLFVSGFLHCDPHPGNVLIRRRPPPQAATTATKTEATNIASNQNSVSEQQKLQYQQQQQETSKSWMMMNFTMSVNNIWQAILGLVNGSESKPTHQVVLIDHGLYIEESEKFRIEHCQMWRAMMVYDIVEMEKICKEWGIGDSAFFASILLMKPFQSFNDQLSAASKSGKEIEKEQRQKEEWKKKKRSKEEWKKLQDAAKQKLRELLSDSSKIPEEFILVGRSMNLVRSINKDTGGLVNRLNILVNEAVRGLSIRRYRHRLDDDSEHDVVYVEFLSQSDKNSNMGVAGGIRHALREFYDIALFRFTLFSLSLAFYLLQQWRLCKHYLYGKDTVGSMEDYMEKGMTEEVDKVSKDLYKSSDDLIDQEQQQS